MSMGIVRLSSSEPLRIVGDRLKHSGPTIHMSLALGVRFQSTTIQKSNSPWLDGDESLAAESAQELADRFAVGAQTLGQLLVAVAIDGAVDIGFTEEQQCQSSRQAAEGERLQLRLAFPQPGAELSQEAQPDLRIAPDQRLQVRPAEDADQ